MLSALEDAEDVQEVAKLKAGSTSKAPVALSVAAKMLAPLTRLKVRARPGVVKHPPRFPQQIGFAWQFCMGAQGAPQPRTAVPCPGGQSPNKDVLRPAPDGTPALAPRMAAAARGTGPLLLAGAFAACVAVTAGITCYCRHQYDRQISNI
jgi:hypothetical protein